MRLTLNIDGLLSTDYALTTEQLETRLRAVIQACLKDCSVDDLHVSVEQLNAEA